MHHLDRKQQIIDGYGFAVVPELIFTQGKGIDKPIRSRPALGQVWHHPALLIEAGQTAKEKAAQIAVDFVGVAQQWIDVLGVAGNAFAEDAAPLRDQNRGDVICGGAHQKREKNDTHDCQQHLPANISAQRRGSAGTCSWSRQIAGRGRMQPRRLGRSLGPRIARPSEWLLIRHGKNHSGQ